VIISTTDKWGKNAGAALEGQQIPVTRISMKDLEDSPVSWDIARPQNSLQSHLTPKKPHELRPHQSEAVDAVFQGWAEGDGTTTDCGKLIMACGTGKTFTSLKIAERLAGDLGDKARILFAVPSISLLSQTLREWNAQSTLDMRSFAVYSDNKVSRATEDMATEDVIIPVTTDGTVLAEKLGGHVVPTTEDEPLAAEGNTNNQGQPQTGEGDAVTGSQMTLFALSEWTQAIYTRIVDKDGTRTYRDDWAADVADIVDRLITRITAVYNETGSCSVMRRRFDAFVQGLRDNLNESGSVADAVSMLAQHLITKPVFDALFEGQNSAEHNPVSKVIQTMVEALNNYGLESETAGLEKFFASVMLRASEVQSAEGKQQVIAELYEKFFPIGFKAQSDALGIVYTPVEIVDFILRAADAASRDTFGKGLTDEGVHILDGFTGTGTFMTRLLQSGLIRPEDLARKYACDLHANELMLLAYYIAEVNMETTYHALTRQPGQDANSQDYEPFPSIVTADTFQISENGEEFDLEVFPANNDRIEAQVAAPINVIVGNPLYSVGQTSASDFNANLKYPTLNARIADTYAKSPAVANGNSLYDSYLRASHWVRNRSAPWESLPSSPTEDGSTGTRPTVSGSPQPKNTHVSTSTTSVIVPVPQVQYTRRTRATSPALGQLPPSPSETGLRIPHTLVSCGIFHKDPYCKKALQDVAAAYRESRLDTDHTEPEDKPMNQRSAASLLGRSSTRRNIRPEHRHPAKSTAPTSRQVATLGVTTSKNRIPQSSVDTKLDNRTIADREEDNHLSNIQSRHLQPSFA
jgi:predicted helicase